VPLSATLWGAIGIRRRAAQIKFQVIDQELVDADVEKLGNP
jgi:hypothetical protein